MKEGTGVMIFVGFLIVGFFLSFMLFMVWIPYEQDQIIESFCVDHGYESYQRDGRGFSWGRDFCITKYNETLIKQEIGLCSEFGQTFEYCFINPD